MPVQVTGTIMPPLPDTQWIVPQHDSFVTIQARGLVATKRQQIMNGLEQGVEFRIPSGIMIASHQDDPFT